jgi:hypothetical protein
MIELPQEYRELLEEQLDAFLESIDGSDDATEVVQDILELLERVAQDCDVSVPGGDIVSYIENDSELEDALFDVLLDELEEEDLADFTGNDMLALLEKIIEIDWVDEDEESFGVEELDEDLGFEAADLNELDEDEY